MPLLSPAATAAALSIFAVFLVALQNSLIRLVADSGILGTISWLCFLRACTLVDASALMPYEFTRLPFVAVFAYLMFGEVPDKWVWLGAAIIFSSTLYIAHREAVAARRAARARLENKLAR